MANWASNLLNWSPFLVDFWLREKKQKVTKILNFLPSLKQKENCENHQMELSQFNFNLVLNSHHVIYQAALQKLKRIRLSTQKHSPFHSQVQKIHSPNLPKEKCISEVVRTGTRIIFHLSKLWKAKLSILCDVIFLVRLQGKLEIDHSWEWKGWPFHSQDWSSSNFSCSLTSHITSHGTKNLTFHSLLRLKDDSCTSSHYLTYTFLLKRLGECTFWAWEWKGSGHL